MASASVGQPSFYCHTCETRIEPITEDVICPNCRGGFVEKLEEETTGSPAANLRPLYHNDMVNPFNLMDLFSEGNTSRPMTNVFSFDLSNHTGPSRSDGNSAAPSSSSAPYNLRQRPDRPGGSRPREVQQPYANEHLIHDLVQRVFGSFDPSVFQISFSGMDGLPPLNTRNLHGNTADYAWGPNGLDNIISQLLGQLENAGPPPASENTIAKLPKISISQGDVDVERDCSVCMNAFKLEENAKKLPCGHFFHIPCIDPWLELHNTCPICRKVVGEDSPCGPQTSSDSTNNNNNTREVDEDANSSSRANASSSGRSNSSSYFSFIPDFFSRRNNDDDHSNNTS